MLDTKPLIKFNHNRAECDHNFGLFIIIIIIIVTQVKLNNNKSINVKSKAEFHLFDRHFAIAVSNVELA